jgi:hypothetical protein
MKHYTKAHGEQRKNIVKVRLTEDELKQVKNIAENLNLSCAEYIRQMIFTGQIKTFINLSCDSEQLKQYCYELNKIGNNLNQIARQINSGEPLSREVLNCIQTVNQAIMSQSEKIHSLFGGQ